eukprot:TRINITY_DN2217_c0_g1_i2.p1 TRINITY_DN2217_c0_g1~~TRINITY_DN2217_c0_g1_i2.p1  ORF type:complete len:1400 (+),score=312.68 TRINITY_DN2217_c0_g1_i2:63-4202(+)
MSGAGSLADGGEDGVREDAGNIDRIVSFAAGVVENDELHQPHKALRPGTGFVHSSDLPDSDAEEVEYEVATEADTITGDVAKAVNFSGEGTPDAQLDRPRIRKGTIFVRPSENGDDDDENYDDDVEDKGAAMANTGELDKTVNFPAGLNDEVHQPRKALRPGTGFVHSSDLPDSETGEEEEEQVDGGETDAVDIAKAVKFSGDVADDHDQHQPHKVLRPGTGFVRLSDMPDSDNEDEEEGATDEGRSTGDAAKAVDFSGEGVLDTQRDRPRVRKGTVFVRSSEVDSDVEENEAGAANAGELDKRVNFSAAVADDDELHQPRKPLRPGTGFVHSSDLPDSDSADEAEEKPTEAETSTVGDAKAVNFSGDAAPDIQRDPPRVRKGTVFVRSSQIDDNDAEENGADAANVGELDKIVRFPADVADDDELHQPHKALRPGTGFVHSSDLPDSDADEEEKEPTGEETDIRDVSKSVNFSVDVVPNAQRDLPHIRKGTVFVRSSEVDNDVDETGASTANTGDLDRTVSFSAGVAENDGLHEPRKALRHGTGFVRSSELPDSDADEEQEEVTEGETTSDDVAKSVNFSEEVIPDAQQDRPRVRKGTIFVRASEVDDDDKGDASDDDDGAEATKADTANEGELDKIVSFSADVAEGDEARQSHKADCPGTGFVHSSDLPDSDAEGEEEKATEEETNARSLAKSVMFIGDVVPDARRDRPRIRKGTQFVRSSQVDSDVDETGANTVNMGELDRIVSFSASVAKSGELHEPRKALRPGTGFVHSSDLPDSDAEEEELEKRVVFSTASTEDELHQPRKALRPGTGFVHSADLPDSDADVDVADETDTEDAAKHVGFAAQMVNFTGEAAAEDALHLARKAIRPGTGFVHSADLPDSDADESEATEGANVSDLGKQVSFSGVAVDNDKSDQLRTENHLEIDAVHPSGVLDADLEGDALNEPGCKSHIHFGQSAFQHSPQKILRDATGFVHPSELSDSETDSEESENQEEEAAAVPASVGLPTEDKAPDTGNVVKSQRKRKPRIKNLVSVSNLPASDDEEDEKDKMQLPQQEIQQPEDEDDLVSAVKKELNPVGAEDGARPSNSQATPNIKASVGISQEIVERELNPGGAADGARSSSGQAAPSGNAPLETEQELDLVASISGLIPASKEAEGTSLPQIRRHIQGATSPGLRQMATSEVLQSALVEESTIRLPALTVWDRQTPISAKQPGSSRQALQLPQLPVIAASPGGGLVLQNSPRALLVHERKPLGPPKAKDPAKAKKPLYLRMEEQFNQHEQEKLDAAKERYVAMVVKAVPPHFVVRKPGVKRKLKQHGSKDSAPAAKGVAPRSRRKPRAAQVANSGDQTAQVSPPELVPKAPATLPSPGRPRRRRAK